MPTPWDDLEPGTVTGAMEFVVTDAMIDEYLEAMELTHPWFEKGDTPYGKRIAPSDMIAKLAMTDVFQNYIQRELGPNMRSRQAFKFIAPVRVGMKVKATGRLTEKYERRGKRFVTLEAMFSDDAGNPLLLDKRTQYLFPPAATT
jgi:acyl dehydratase